MFLSRIEVYPCHGVHEVHPDTFRPIGDIIQLATEFPTIHYGIEAEAIEIRERAYAKKEKHSARNAEPNSTRSRIVKFISYLRDGALIDCRDDSIGVPIETVDP